jgi:hypothetical protein
MSKMRAMEPDGHAARLGDEDDVEGHSLTRAVETDGFTAKMRKVDEDDVEGHFARIKSPQSRGE